MRNISFLDEQSIEDDQINILNEKPNNFFSFTKSKSTNNLKIPGDTHFFNKIDNFFNFPNFSLSDKNDNYDEQSINDIYFISPKTTKIEPNKETSIIINPNQKDSLELKKTDKNINSENNKSDSSEHLKLGLLKKKRGRKFKSQITKESQQHSAGDTDNVQRKIQVNFFSFLINFANDAIKSVLGKKAKSSFKHIDYELKRIIDFNNFEKMKKWTYYDVLKLKISKKYTNYNEYYNELILKKLCIKSKVLKMFFRQNFLDVFKKYYYCEQKKEKILKFNDLEIILGTKTKCFSDLIEESPLIKETLIKIVKDFYFYNDNEETTKPKFVVSKIDLEK